MTLDIAIDVSSLLANAATFLGIPLALLVFILDRHRARRDREQQTYQTLQSAYSEYLRLCLERPELQLHDYNRDLSVELSAVDQRRKMVGLELLVSMFESAFFLYHLDQHSDFRRRQWSGWDAFMRDWASRKDFRRAWNEHLGDQFDSQFMAHMNRLVAESTPTV